MLRIKRLYTFIYQTFLPIFAMTFGVCLFIFMIQLLWQHIDKLVGKGLDTSVIVEFFMYAALMLIPQALPLAILLASLMTFGNLGERLELVAIKAAGVSLMEVMKPMIILVAIMTLGSFWFQNNVAPRINVKVYSLLYSMKEKTPELDIPEGSFYNAIRGYSIYVKKKNLETHVLHDVIIYDTSSGGFKNMSVDVCDSAIMKVADSKDYLTLTMFDGERFFNLKDEPGKRASKSSESGDFVPYMRENFKKKEVIIPFDDDFVRMDESNWDNSQVSKNLDQLRTSIDSMKTQLDSLNRLDRKTISEQAFLNNRPKKAEQDSTLVAEQIEVVDVGKVKAFALDSVLNSYAIHLQNDIMISAASEAKGISGNHLLYFHVDMPKPQKQKNVRLHGVFWHRMFSLPIACLVFFFIGAPLGSIIRKGGLGLPAVISVILFIIYYIIDNIGYKMARDGVWEVWQGVWLSTAVLLPLGVFLTYKSMNESALFNVELYGKSIRKFLKTKSNPNWRVTKEPKLEEILPLSAINIDSEDVETLKEQDNNMLKDIVNNYKEYGYSMEYQYAALAILKERGTYLFDVRVNNYDYNYSKKLFELFKNNSIYFSIPLYVLTLVSLLMWLVVKITFFKWIVILAGVAYLAFFIKSAIYVADFYKSMNKKEKSLGIIMRYFVYFFVYGKDYHGLEKNENWAEKCVKQILAFLSYPIYYLNVSKDMKRELENIKNQRF